MLSAISASPDRDWYARGSARTHHLTASSIQIGARRTEPAPAKKRRELPSTRLPHGVTPAALNREQAAEFVGLSPNTFDSLIASGSMPPPRHAGARRLWIIRELERALERIPKAGGESQIPPSKNSALDDWD